MMKINDKVLCLAATFSFLCGSILPSYFQTAEAAKKYYPPGFTPPSDTKLIPKQNTSPTKIYIPVREEGPTQTIIRTITVPTRPKDKLVALLEEQRYTEALRLADQRLKKSPANYALRLIRAQILREKESFDASETEYKAIIAKSKSKDLISKAYNGLGLTQMAEALQAKRLGDTTAMVNGLKLSETSFRQALKINPKLVTAWNSLAQWSIVQNRVSDAQLAIGKARQISPSDTQVLLTQSQLYLVENKPDEALPLIYKAKQQAPHEVKGSLLLGQAYLSQERYDDAIIQLQQVLDQQPDQAEALKLLSTAYERKMKPDDAEMVLHKAVSLNPADEEAAISLLKLYDQRDERENSILLLKNLLKSQPRQLSYQKELLKRLARQGNWDEIYTQTKDSMNSLLSADTVDTDSVDTIASYYAHAAFLKSKGLLDKEAFLHEPTARKVLEYFENKLAKAPDNTMYRLNVLLFNPLTVLPPQKNTAYKGNELFDMLKISFLEGNREAHAQVLQSIMAQQPDFSSEILLDQARELVDLGDYDSAQRLIGLIKDSPPTTRELSSQISEFNRKADEQLKGLEMLPGRIPREHWANTAEEALKLSTGNWKLHAILAESLLDQKNYTLALVQQKLAAQYAPSQEERKRWLKKIQKTQQKIEKTNH